MYRPACRMNHTGVASTGSRRHALRKRSFTGRAPDGEGPAARRSAWIGFAIHATVLSSPGFGSPLPGGAGLRIGCLSFGFPAISAGYANTYLCHTFREDGIVPHASAVLVPISPGHRGRPARARRRGDSRHRGLESRPDLRLGGDTEGEAARGPAGPRGPGAEGAPVASPGPGRRRPGNGGSHGRRGGWPGRGASSAAPNDRGGSRGGGRRRQTAGAPAAPDESDGTPVARAGRRRRRRRRRGGGAGDERSAPAAVAAAPPAESDSEPA